jgi:hypothetical protein
MTIGYQGDAAAEIRSGRSRAYFDYIERIYGDAFRAGTDDATETFALLYQEISALGNQKATDTFGERFVSMLPSCARRKIVNEYLHKPMRPNDPSS